MPKKEKKKKLIELPEDAFPNAETLKLLTHPKPTGEDPMKLFLHGPGYSKRQPDRTTNTAKTTYRAKTTKTPNTTKTANEAPHGKQAIPPSGSFQGKEQTLYDYLYTLTLGNGQNSVRYCRVSNQVLMDRCRISKITLPRCKQRLQNRGLIHEVVVRGFQGGNFYLVFLPQEQGTARTVSAMLKNISPHQEAVSTENLILKALESLETVAGEKAGRSELNT